MKSNAIFMNFHTRLQSTDFVVVLDKILIPEDEDEKYQIRLQKGVAAATATPFLYGERWLLRGSGFPSSPSGLRRASRVQC